MAKKKKQTLYDRVSKLSEAKKLFLFLIVFAVIGGGYMTYSSFAAEDCKLVGTDIHRDDNKAKFHLTYSCKNKKNYMNIQMYAYAEKCDNNAPAIRGSSDLNAPAPPSAPAGSAPATPTAPAASAPATPSAPKTVNYNKDAKKIEQTFSIPLRDGCWRYFASGGGWWSKTNGGENHGIKRKKSHDTFYKAN